MSLLPVVKQHHYLPANSLFPSVALVVWIRILRLVSKQADFCCREGGLLGFGLSTASFWGKKCICGTQPRGTSVLASLHGQFATDTAGSVQLLRLDPARALCGLCAGVYPSKGGFTHRGRSLAPGLHRLTDTRGNSRCMCAQHSEPKEGTLRSELAPHSCVLTSVSV